MLTSADAFFTRAKAWTSALGIFFSLILKFSSERWVCAPHSLSLGTFISPIVSFSMRKPEPVLPTSVPSRLRWRNQKIEFYGRRRSTVKLIKERQSKKRQTKRKRSVQSIGSKAHITDQAFPQKQLPLRWMSPITSKHSQFGRSARVLIQLHLFGSQALLEIVPGPVVVLTK